MNEIIDTEDEEIEENYEVSIFSKDTNIQASQTILKRGLESFGIGTIPMDLKHKAFRSTSLEVAS